MRVYSFQAEEDKKNLSRVQALSDKLQLKVQSYKQQVEAAVSASSALRSPWPLLLVNALSLGNFPAEATI